ncbi:hypothetical protein JX266_001207 [Neoarthrinium moseri]|nr:hypothetical protein JX266_001207 [Neoarthrinium moseri]
MALGVRSEALPRSSVNWSSKSSDTHSNLALVHFSVIWQSFLVSVLALGPIAVLFCGWLQNRTLRIKGDIYANPSLRALFNAETQHLTTQSGNVPADQGTIVNKIRLHNSWFYGKDIDGYWTPLAGRCIRLLSIHPGNFDDPIKCTLLTRTLNSKSRYVAVSYAWGDLQAPKVITVNGVYGFIVSENAYHVLRRIRALGERRYVWIDAICINQSVNQERGSQIELMDQIYSFAKHVYIYLGPCRSSTNARQDCEIEQCQKHNHQLIRTPSELGAGTWLHDTFPQQSQWWYRLWTVQEAVLARDIQVLIGPHLFAWNDLTLLARSARLPHFANQSIAALDDLRYAWNVQEHRKGLLLSELIQRSANRKATEPLDKIYGLLAMARNPIMVDYSIKMQELNTKVTRHIIETERSLDVYLRGNWAKPKELPRWSLNFHEPDTTWVSALDLCMEFSGNKPCATFDGDLWVKFEDQHMICRGLNFDKIIMRIEFFKGKNPTIEVGGGFQLEPPDSSTIDLEQFANEQERLNFLAVEMQHLTTDIVSRSARSHNAISKMFRKQDSTDWNYTERYKLKGSKVGIFSLGGYISGTKPKVRRIGREKHSTEPEPTFQRYAQHCIASPKSTFFLTSLGFIGVAYGVTLQTEPSDLVTVMFGASMPLILRGGKFGRLDDQFSIICGAYVSCLMQGQLLELYRDYRSFRII